MTPLLGTLYLLGMLAPGALGYTRSLVQHRQEVRNEKVSQWKSLETYSYNKFHPMEEIYQWMKQISEKYTEVVTQHSLGMTDEDRPMYYLKISQPSNNSKKIIWIDCGIHAREWIAPAFCQWFVKEDRFWRKSRSSHNNGTCFGTDRNRNFNASWCTVGTSKNCQDITFCGTGPVSEPETKAVTSFVESQKEDILCYLTIHSYGQFILTPYGYTKNKTSNREELIRVGQKAANALKAKHGTNYTVGATSHVLYDVSESSKDWARGTGIPFSFTFELRDHGLYRFLMSEAQIQPVCEETMEAVLSILDDVYEKYWPSSSTGKVPSR